MYFSWLSLNVLLQKMKRTWLREELRDKEPGDGAGSWGKPINCGVDEEEEDDDDGDDNGGGYSFDMICSLKIKNILKLKHIS